MALWLKRNHIIRTAHAVRGRLSRKSGNILVYVVMIMVIFALLGVAMVSLFTTSIGSSATVNDTRRATYLSESGIRYAMSELRAADFSKTTITSLNKNFKNDDYKISPKETFGLNVFSPWFESASSYPTGTQSVNVDVQEGELPAEFLTSLPAGDPGLLLVNYNYLDLSNPDAQSPITGFTSGTPPWTPTSFQIQLANDFVAHINEQVALAVTPFAGAGNQTIPVGQGFLDLKLAAKNVFPQAGGAFTVKDRDFYYMRVDPTITDRVRLTGVKWAAGASFPDVTVTSDDPVILTPLRNRLIVSEGRSGLVSFGNRIDYAAAIVDYSPLPKSRKPDIAFEEEADLASKLSQVEQGSNPDFITVDNTEKFLTIGGGGGPSLGAVWFQDTRSIGGQREFCNANGCFFKDGIRVFFTVEYTGNGDGFVFALLNGSGTDVFGNLKNNTGSVGGDIERSEMLGYAGDSRLAVVPGPTQFLDTSPPRGLVPPKIGLEFDTKVNFSASAADCADATSLNANTRNDPGTPAGENRDAVQFVYWGANALDIPCREQPFCGSTPSCTGDPSYDDNRHNALFPNWEFNTNGAIQSSPALAADGTIYVGSDSNNFFAVNPDGTVKWSLSRGGDWFSPTVTSSGRIYVGTGSPDNQLYAFRADGSNVGGFPFLAGGAVTTKPAVGTTGDSNGIVYFGSDDGGLLYAVRTSGTPGTSAWTFNTGGPVKSSPAISTSGNTVYFGTTTTGIFWALRANTGAPEHFFSVATPFHSSPVVGPDGTIYVGNDDGRLYAISASFSTSRSFSTGARVRSSPALSNDGSTVYVGADNGILFALDTTSPSLSEKWRFTGPTDAIQSPITVDANDHIYFGSNDNNVYALYADGTEKWHFTTGGNVEVKPAVKADGTVYAGSRDDHLYSINQFTDPKNLKDLLITSSGLSPVRVGGVPVTMTSLEATDWLKKGPWSLRLEITRNPSEPLVPGVYNLRAWARQCNQTDCSDVLGTFFEDTRVQYAPATPTPRPPMIEQTINLDSSNHTDFDRFLFGFTSQTATGESQTATIRKFQLSFIRSGDFTVIDDPGWP